MRNAAYEYRISWRQIMSEMHRYYDPMAEAFFSDESKEYAERTGLALIAAAQHAAISFGKHILPQVSARTPDGATYFRFSCGIDYDMGAADALIQKYPDDEAQIRTYKEKFQAYDLLAHKSYRTPAGERLTGAQAMWGGSWGGHSNPDFGLIVNIGTEGVRKRIEAGRTNHPEAAWFYNGCSFAMDALDILGERFRQLAESMAENCTDPLDQKRYARAAQAFSVVPKKPAGDFTEACHVFWMLFTFDGIDSPGRFDQYMRRAYEASDDRAEVLDILSRLWDCFHDTRTWNLCISGSDEAWTDETNALTYDILAMAAEKRYHTPNITLRVHRNTPEKLWNAIADTLATGIGMPALYSDEAVCPALEKLGIPPCDSHDYCMNGCNQIDIMGKSHMGLEDGEVNFGKVLEYTLHNGVNSMNGNLESIQTGAPTSFASFAEFENAFYQQMDYVVLHTCMSANNSQHTRAIFSPNPLRSCLIEGCLEKGVDYRNGGPLYNHGQILAEAIADTGDSLWAIFRLIYEEKKYTMAELLAALNANFEGYDQLYYDFSHCEKFGNDCRGVDELTSRFVNRFFRILNRHHTYRGGVFSGGCSTYSRAANYGRSIGALPNGHHKGDPLIADSIGAVPGCDCNGPTALLKSVLHYEHDLATSGFVLQVKFEKKLFATEKGKQSFIALAKAFFHGGGQQYTVNVLDPEELLDAKIHPENHRNLIVRVGGYSEYFVNLEPGLQDNVIARTSVAL